MSELEVVEMKGRRARAIDQAELLRYVEVRNKLLPIAREFCELQEDFLIRLRAGAKVEPGPLTAELKVTSEPGQRTEEVHVM